jgi:Uma2 family endonuclease
MVFPEKSKLYTVDEFEEFTSRPENSDRLFELINGEIVEKVTTEEHSLIVGNVYRPLWSFVDKRDLGRVNFRVQRRTVADEYNERQPDVEFTRKERLLPIVREGAVPQMSDLAVEVKAPNDSISKLREKAIYYLANGTHLVWLVFPVKRLVIVNAHALEVLRTEGDVLDGGDVLPGFQLPVRDIFNV